MIKLLLKRLEIRWGRYSPEVAFALHTQPARVQFSAFPRFFRNFLMLLRFNDSALLWEWTVQSLKVVRTHLVLISGRLVLQKRLELTKLRMGKSSQQLLALIHPKLDVYYFYISHQPKLRTSDSTEETEKHSSFKRASASEPPNESWVEKCKEGPCTRLFNLFISLFCHPQFFLPSCLERKNIGASFAGNFKSSNQLFSTNYSSPKIIKSLGQTHQKWKGVPV